MIVIETKNWRRVSKPVAKRLFNDGQDVYCLSNKMNPENIWMSPAKIIDDFDRFVNEYSYYNCNRECGKDVYYYVKTN